MEFKDSGTKYKNRVKSRVMNLRDKNNPNLKLKVLHGDLTAERFAVMKPEVLLTLGIILVVYHTFPLFFAFSV